MRRVLLGIFAALLTLPAIAEAGSTIQVDYSNPGLVPSQWTLVIHPDGSGHFHAERGGETQGLPHAMEAANVDKDVSLSGSYAAYVFATVHHHKLLRQGCESHMKVAFQGWKKIRYSGPDGEGGCEFNYSKDKDIQQLGDSLVAVASTIIEGARLEMLLQHDPLGLDKEIQYIVEASGDGRLLQICSIRSILERLENNPSVLERVRKRARTLLALVDK